MGRFWMQDDFVRKHARHIKTSDQAVYMALSSYANGNNETFVGVRTIANNLKMNKDTVSRCINRLIVSGLVRRLDKKIRGKVSVLELLCVPFNKDEVSESFRPKEYNKELFKEKKRFYKKSEPESIGNIIQHKSRAYRELEKRWGRKRT